MQVLLRSYFSSYGRKSKPPASRVVVDYSDGVMAMHQISAALMVGNPEKGPSTATRAEDYQRWWKTFEPLFAELMLVTPDPVACLAWDGLIMRGQYRPNAPLSTVRSALQVAQHDQLLAFAPAEAGFPAQVIDALATGVAPRWDVIALDHGDGCHNLPMVFHKRCIKVMDRHLSGENDGIQAFMQQVRLHTIAISDLAIG